MTWQVLEVSCRHDQQDDGSVTTTIQVKGLNRSQAVRLGERLYDPVRAAIDDTAVEDGVDPENIVRCAIDGKTQ